MLSTILELRKSSSRWSLLKRANNALGYDDICTHAGKMRGMQRGKERKKNFKEGKGSAGVLKQT